MADTVRIMATGSRRSTLATTLGDAARYLGLLSAGLRE
jgi:hypothetical protein